MMVKTKGKNREDAIAGDILCAKEDGSKAVFDATDYDSIPLDWTPIGVVVIPPSHDVYGTGEGAAISLKWMSCETPDTGSDERYRMYHGDPTLYPKRTEQVQCDFRNFCTTDNLQPPTITYDVFGGNYGYLPEDSPYDDEIQSINDPIAKYSTWEIENNKYLVPSPYAQDGSRYEPFYDSGEYDSNALSDFNGKEHTKDMCSYSTWYEWKTSTNVHDGETDFYPPSMLLLEVSYYWYKSG